MKKMLHGVLGVALIAVSGVAAAGGSVSAADSTVVVRPTDLNGWTVDTVALGNLFVPTTFFGPADVDAGFGSFQFGPIAGSDRYAKLEIMAPLFSTPVADFGGMQYDFQVLADTDVVGVSAKQFYTNVYVDSAENGIGIYNTWYDCRYAFVPLTSGDGWNTFGFDDTTAATVTTGLGCPTSLEGLPDDSEIMFFRLSGGDTSLSDSGLIGAYDLISFTIDNDTTTYDFEPDPTSKDACRTGGFADYGFANQGQCIGFFNTGLDSR